MSAPSSAPSSTLPPSSTLSSFPRPLIRNLSDLCAALGSYVEIRSIILRHWDGGLLSSLEGKLMRIKAIVDHASSSQPFRPSHDSRKLTSFYAPPSVDAILLPAEVNTTRRLLLAICQAGMRRPGLEALEAVLRCVITALSYIWTEDNTLGFGETYDLIKWTCINELQPLITSHPATQQFKSLPTARTSFLIMHPFPDAYQPSWAHWWFFNWYQKWYPAMLERLGLFDMSVVLAREDADAPAVWWGLPWETQTFTPYQDDGGGFGPRVTYMRLKCSNKGRRYDEEGGEDEGREIGMGHGAGWMTRFDCEFLDIIYP